MESELLVCESIFSHGHLFIYFLLSEFFYKINAFRITLGIRSAFFWGPFFAKRLTQKRGLPTPNREPF